MKAGCAGRGGGNKGGAAGRKGGQQPKQRQPQPKQRQPQPKQRQPQPKQRQPQRQQSKKRNERVKEWVLKASDLVHRPANGRNFRAKSQKAAGSGALCALAASVLRRSTRGMQKEASEAPNAENWARGVRGQWIPARSAGRRACCAQRLRGSTCCGRTCPRPLRCSRGAAWRSWPWRTPRSM